MIHTIDAHMKGSPKKSHGSHLKMAMITSIDQVPGGSGKHLQRWRQHHLGRRRRDGII